MRIPIPGSTTIAARRFCIETWPNRDVKLYGFDNNNEMVYISTIRGSTTGPIATAVKNRSDKPTRFEAELGEM